LANERYDKAPIDREVLTLADFPPEFLVATAVALGLVFGSFLNVVIHRLPRGENLAFPASRCPGCGKPIAARDNVPILSWLLLRGRARCCGTKISPRYPLVELIGGLVALAIVRVIVFELPPETPAWKIPLVFSCWLALGLGLVAAAFIDLEHLYLPDSITLGGTVLGIASVPLRPDATFSESLIGAVSGFLVIWLPFIFLYQRIRGRPGMGLGDAKLVMLAGAWFGWFGAVFALLAGAVQATAVTLAVLATRGKLEEPDAVKEERRALREALANAEGEEREALERELKDDPLAEEPEPGLGGARLAFGPFIVLAILELMLFGNWIRAEILGAMMLP
jgi:leader peptidase (prepilin peptidase)/N-methyltransferase